MGGSLAGYFGVFHRLMAAKLLEAASAQDEQALEALTRVLKEDCCASQHTYVHAQQVGQAWRLGGQQADRLGSRACFGPQLRCLCSHPNLPPNCPTPAGAAGASQAPAWRAVPPHCAGAPPAWERLLWVLVGWDTK